jgi:hypothetical protein
MCKQHPGGLRSSLSKLVEKEEIGKIFAVVGICQAVISLAGYRYSHPSFFSSVISLLFLYFCKCFRFWNFGDAGVGPGKPDVLPA